MDFHIHLHSCNAFRRPSDFKIHIASKIFGISNIANNHRLFVFNKQSHSNTAYRRL